MEQYVTRIGDVTIQRVIPSGGGLPEPVRVMDGEELLRAVKEEPLEEDEEEGEEETPMESGEGEPSLEETVGEKGEGDKDDDHEDEGEGNEEDEDDGEEKIIIKAEPQDQDELLGEGVETEHMTEGGDNQEGSEEDDIEGEIRKDQSKPGEEEKDEGGESSKRKADNEKEEDEESSLKKKKVEIDVDLDKKKISNLRRNIREVMDETQLDESTLAAQRQEAERLKRVQDQQKYIREIQRQIQLNRQNSKTQSRVISLLQGGSTSILKSSSVGSNTTATSTGPSTVLVKVGSGQQQVLNRKTLEVLRGSKSISSTTEPMRSGIARVTPGNKPAMVTPSVSIAPVKPVMHGGEAPKKVPPNDADVVTISSSSDSENDCIVISEGEEEPEDEEEDVDPTNSGMHTNDLYNIPDDQGRVLINVGKPENEPEIFLAPQIARVIKPHQIGGVRFLFDNVVESIERFNNSTGFGCILAHSMGLGKTLQVVSFCDVFLRETSARTVMCIMPINTLQNWVAEFNMWLPTDPTNSPLAVHGEVRPRNFKIFILNDLHKTVASRARVVEEWAREGGVLLIGYEMYRQLSLKRASRVRKGKKKQQVEEEVDDEKNKPLLDAMHEALVKPGPDLVICDEGHRIKNSHASISHALKQIRTKRRVVLTGYPLQNNLLEYWCMVDFVRPNYLGTKTEFSNMFERPIQNGQCIDSTPQDIRLMRYRAHVLHSLLEGFVQRRSHSVLRNSLPQKEEYVLLVRMTTLQRKLYDTFMNEVVRTKAVPNPLKAFAVCCKIWNHPDILYNFLKKREMDELQDLDLEETASLQQQHPGGPNSPRRPLAKEKRGKKEVKKAQVAPIKAEVTSQSQSQPQTPDLKQEEQRRFDFPNSGQGGPTGYNYYPPPPPFSEAPYQYPRPPGAYYPGYYGQDGHHPPGAPFYHHPPPNYDQPGYPGYYNYEAPYSKGEEFGKQSWSNPPFPAPNIKQEKNSSKSPKDNESSSKPGYQEYYPIKQEEKTEIKEEKQTFFSGFSGGHVSYNYRSFPGGYSDYPYPPNEESSWNRSGFPSFPPGDSRTAGNQGPTGSAPGSNSSNSGMFPGQSQSDGQHRSNPNQDISPSTQVHQGAQNSGSDRSQHNPSTHDPNFVSDSQQTSFSNDNLHRMHGSQDQHSIVSQNSMHSNYMNVHSGHKSNDHLKKPLNDSQAMCGNTKQDDNMLRNQDNSAGKNRSIQENDPNHLQNNNPSGQHSFFNPQDSIRNQHQQYGNRSQQDDFRMPFGSSDRHPAGLPNPHDNQGNYGAPSHKNNSQQQFSNPQASPSSQPMSNPEQNMPHGHNPYDNQRNDQGLRGTSDQMSNVHHPAMHNEQEKITGVHPSMFSNQESQSSHEVSNRTFSNLDHFSSNQKNMYTNKRNDPNLPFNQDQTSQPIGMGGHPIQESPRRSSFGHENIHSQSNMFPNQRNDNIPHGFLEHTPQSQQNSPASHEKQDNQSRHGNQDRHGPTQQTFNNQRNENESQLAAQNSKHRQQTNMGASSPLEHSGQQNSVMMPNNSHGSYGNQEPMQGNQHYRVQNQNENQHRGVENYYGNQFSQNSSSSQDHQQNPVNQNTAHNQKRGSSGHEHSTGMQQNMYPNQIDHSVQKMIRNDSHVDFHQMRPGNQERPPTQFDLYSSESHYHNQQSHQGPHDSNIQIPNDKQMNQESPGNAHLSRERSSNSQGGHGSQDRQGPGSLFDNLNTQDLGWVNNQDRSMHAQNIYDENQINKDDSGQLNKEKQQIHSNQNYLPLTQPNAYGSQNSQGLHRNPDMHGLNQNMLGHENPFMIGKDRNQTPERNSGLLSVMDNKTTSHELMQVQSRQNNQDQSVHHPQQQNNMQNFQNPHNIHGNQQMMQNPVHSSQEQMHNLAVNKSGSQRSSDHPFPGPNSQAGGPQTMLNMPNYGSPSGAHQTNQHSSYGNQNYNHPMSNQEQQHGNSHPLPENQHIYGNQYLMQNDQLNVNQNQVGKNPHYAQSHPPVQMFGSQASQVNPQGNSGQGLPYPIQNQGVHSSQNPNSQNNHSAQGQIGSGAMSQGHHGSTPNNSGPPGPSPNQGPQGFNQGQQVSQYPSHMNQPHPSGSQYLSGMHPMMGSKDQETSFSAGHSNSQLISSTNPPSNNPNIQPDQNGTNQNSKMGQAQHNMSSPVSLHNKTHNTPPKNDFQKIPSSPMPHLSPHQQMQPVSQQGTQTQVDNCGQGSGSQHRIQNMLSRQHIQCHSSAYEQNIITSSKGMSGGQVLQGMQQQKHSVHDVLGKNDEQGKNSGNINEPFPSTNENYHGNFQKPGFYGQDYQYPYPGQFPYQGKHGPNQEQPGPSGHAYRKEDDKTNGENRSMNFEKRFQEEGEEMHKTISTSTSTETEEDREKKDKKDEEEKVDKKQDGTPQKNVKEDPGIPYDWAYEILKGYIPGDIGASAKMAIFFCILEESIALGDRILVFSQSLFTLNLMEELLQQQLVPGRQDERWAKNINYYRLDGSTSALEREKLINEFNSNANLHLFLVSTRAGSLGINLVGANRVIVFDASWNPCHDTQAVCRVYRYGQKKPCFVYRLVTDNCLEKKIYDRQINKQGMSDRVVDECNPDAHLSIKEVTSLCWDDKEDDATPRDFTKLQEQYIDIVLQKVIQRHCSELSKEPFAHESLLVDRKEKKLSSAEKRLAKRSYELEKQASTRPVYNGINQNQVRPKPMASVRPMQAEMGQAGRPRGWIPASVWQRQGMSAQEMTLPLDVVIPTNAADRSSIVLKAGQKVMVLKSPKGIYMQLETGKIIAIRTAFKLGSKKPGEQGRAGSLDITQQRRGLRQIGATRGRPIRAVGPTTRPLPGAVSIIKKRINDEDQPGRKDEESESSDQPTPMEVTDAQASEKETDQEKEKEEKSNSDTPNPFTAAAAASLSSKQVPPCEDEKMDESPGQMNPAPGKPQASPVSFSSQSQATQIMPQKQQPPTTVPVQPQFSTTLQPPAPIQPLPAKPLPSFPQVTVQPIVKSSQTQPPSPAPVPPQTSVHKPSQIPIQPQPSVQVPIQPQLPAQITVEPQPRRPLHVQHSVQTQQSPLPTHGQPPYPSQSQPLSSHPPQPHTSLSQQHTQTPASLQTQASVPSHSQVSTSMHARSHGQAAMQTNNQVSNSVQTSTQAAPSMQAHTPASLQTNTYATTSMQTHPQSASSALAHTPSSTAMQSHTSSTSMQSHSQTSQPMHMHTQLSPSAQSRPQTTASMETQSVVSTPIQAQPPVSLHPHYPIPSHPQAPFPMQQAPHHPAQYPMQSPQKQPHFTSLTPHQFQLPPQQPQYPIPPQQSQFLGHPAHQSYPMHPQPQYPMHPQQPYPVQPQPQYPLQPHIQPPQFSGQPHQFPLHPQPQFPLQPPSQFDPLPPVPSSMMTDHIS